MNTCKSCKFWSRNTQDDYHYNEDLQKLIGSCSMSDDKGLGKDFFGAYGGGNYDEFYCGEDFGCINHEEKI